MLGMRGMVCMERMHRMNGWDAWDGWDGIGCMVGAGEAGLLTARTSF